MPSPHHCEMSAEAFCGAVVVAALILMFVGISHTLAWHSRSVWTWVCLAFVYTEAAVAIGCWCRFDIAIAPHRDRCDETR